MNTIPIPSRRIFSALLALQVGAGTVCGAIMDLNSLDTLVTGNHSVTADGQTFDGYVRNDGGTGWLLVGRGRNGWEFDTDGQGAVADVGVAANLETSAAFSPALYSDAIINDLISNSTADFTGVEIRFRRAGDSAGLDPYQEARWRPTTQTAWTGDFDFANPGYAVEHEILSGIGAPVGPVNAHSQDAIAGGNDFSRIFTWSWGGHGGQQGFSYGNVITDGANNATSFWWENGNENHAIPYTEVYVRLLNPAPSSVQLSPREVLSDAGAGDVIGTLTTPLGDAGDTFTYSLVAGEGDADNGKFQINGDQLEAGAHDFSTESEGALFTVRVSSLGAPSGQQVEGNVIVVLVIQTDTDHDNLLDAWEEQWAGAGNLGTLSGLADANADGDTLTDLEEFNLRDQFPNLDPTKADSDGDTLDDGEELDGAGDRPATDPTNPDTDGDGLDDAAESNTGNFADATDTGSDPTKIDTDGDGISDGGEVGVGKDPNDANSKPSGINQLNSLDSLATGNHFFTAGGQTFDAYVDNDGTTGWLLVGRGRNGWEFDTDGQGSVAEVGVAANLETPAAFTPALYSDAIINDLIATSGFDLTEVEIRFRRAGDSAGTDPYQEARWRPITQTDWTGDFDATNPGYAVEHEILSGIGGPAGPIVADSRDAIQGGNDFTRIFTWAWGGHGNQQGFSYGNVVTDGANNETSFWWESGNENHALPYTEVYVRLLNPIPVPDDFQLAITRDGSDLAIEWESQSGRLYNLRSTTDPASALPGDWPIYEGNQDLEATPPINTLTIALPADPKRFFVVESFPAPPVTVLSDDFESGQGAWATGSDGAAGTEWELGTPSLVGPLVTNSGANCFGTNLDGNYEIDANVWLRSPEVDLTDASAATLSYAEFKDIELMFDSGTISILDASDDSLIVEIDTGIEGQSGQWDFVSHQLPAEVLDKVIKIEFRFMSDNFANLAGWYIDDVVVTTPAP